MKYMFYFLHHAQTNWNDKGLVMGQHDVPLNSLGRKQALKAGQILAGLSIATLFYSPLTRAKETAQIVIKECPCSLFPMDNLKERCWGELEGFAVSNEELLKADKKLPHGAESKEDFRKRVIDGMKKAASYPEPILFVSHHGVFEIICSELNQNAPSLPNTSIAHFFQQLGKWHVEILT